MNFTFIQITSQLLWQIHHDENVSFDADDDEARGDVFKLPPFWLKNSLEIKKEAKKGLFVN